MTDEEAQTYLEGLSALQPGVPDLRRRSVITSPQIAPPCLSRTTF